MNWSHYYTVLSNEIHNEDMNIVTKIHKEYIIYAKQRKIYQESILELMGSCREGWLSFLLFSKDICMAIQRKIIVLLLHNDLKLLIEQSKK
jgi:hypothetical protein